MDVRVIEDTFRSKPQRTLVNVTMTEMANQIKVGRVYLSQMHSISSDANYLRESHFEREMWEL